jgi:hypothetical protein
MATKPTDSIRKMQETDLGGPCLASFKVGLIAKTLAAFDFGDRQ